MPEIDIQTTEVKKNPKFEAVKGLFAAYGMQMAGLTTLPIYSKKGGSSNNKQKY